MNLQDRSRFFAKSGLTPGERVSVNAGAQWLLGEGEFAPGVQVTRVDFGEGASTVTLDFEGLVPAGASFPICVLRCRPEERRVSGLGWRSHVRKRNRGNLRHPRCREALSLGETWVQALSEVDLRIHSGDLLALSGPSGSGKTTLLNLIGCLDHASTGQVFLDGWSWGDCRQSSLPRFARSKSVLCFSPST